jgi:hypothetical protein
VSRWVNFVLFTLCDVVTGFSIAYELVPHWLAMTGVGTAIGACWVFIVTESLVERR